MKKKLLLQEEQIRNFCYSLLPRLQRYLVMALGGHDPVTVNYLIYRSGLLSQQAISGKYALGMKPVVAAQVRCVQQAICKLDKSYAKRFGCKPGVRRVEIINGVAEGYPVGPA